MSLSTRPHLCQCGTVLDRDSNAAINILELGSCTVGHTGSYASGEEAATHLLETAVEHVTSLQQEPSSATMESSSFAVLRTGRMSNP
ncbi:hypothetical protein [Parathermosynechococcus lividus]|uniref:hypothetical protein n=1 Tax=Parathermosynechococcus lividus TaxID=33070 RepID=UPI0035E42E3B